MYSCKQKQISPAQTLLLNPADEVSYRKENNNNNKNNNKKNLSGSIKAET